MLRFTSAAATARRLPSCIANAGRATNSPACRPPTTALRCRRVDTPSLRVFASSSDDLKETNGGDETSASSTSASEQQPSTTPNLLSRESRQSETQAVNLRAVRVPDQMSAAAEQLKKRLGGAVVVFFCFKDFSFLACFLDLLHLTVINSKKKTQQTDKPSTTSPDAALAGAKKLVLGGNDSEEKWRELDEKFNEYPDLRTFKGIGEAGADPGLFKRAVVAAVESVVGPVDEAKQVSVRDSSGGKYVSVTVGPVTVNSGDEVVKVYAAMRETAGKMLKFYI